MAKVSRTNTGGLHDIVHENGDLERIEKEDTTSTRDFKNAMTKRRYLKGNALPDDVRRFEKLYKLKVKGSIGFEIWTDEGNGMKVLIKGRELLLPKGRYRIVRKYRRLFFFTMKEEDDFLLDRDMEV